MTHIEQNRRAREHRKVNRRVQLRQLQRALALRQVRLEKQIQYSLLLRHRIDELLKERTK